MKISMLTRVSAALRPTSRGLGFSALGGFGGRAATCGDAASGDNEGAELDEEEVEGSSGMTIGGRSVSTLSREPSLDDDATGACPVGANEDAHATPPGLSTSRSVRPVH